MESMNKKGLGIGDMFPAVLAIVLVGVVLGIGLYILAEVNDNIDDGNASLALNETVIGLADLASWIGIIVIVIAAAIVIGLLVRSFGGGGRAS